MGLHAFADPPAHLDGYRTFDAVRVVGLAERWNMPVVRIVARLPMQDFAPAPHYVLTYQFGGGGVRRRDGQRFRRIARKGSVSLQVPGSGARIAAEGDGEIDYAHLYFAQSLVDEIGLANPLEDFFGDAGCPARSDLTSYLDRAFSRIDPPSSLEMDHRAYALVVRIGKGRGALRPPGPLTARTIDDLRRFISVNIGRSIRLSELAEQAQLSPFHFSRSFAAAVGRPPAAFVAAMRVEEARRLISDTRLPLAEIAARTGFAHHSHMTNRLKRAFGVSPSDLRKGGPFSEAAAARRS